VDGVAIATAEGDSRAHKRQKGNDYLFNLITNDPLPSNDNIYILTNIATGDSTLSLSALIDSGAIHANYCSRKVATWVKKQQQQDASKHRCKLSKEESNVSSISILADSHNTIISKEVVSFDFIFFNELTKSFDTLSCLKFYVIESNIDLIVGLPTIRKHRLAISKLPSVFEGERGLNHDMSTGAKTSGAVNLGDLPEPNQCKDQGCSIDHSDPVTNTICMDCASVSFGPVHTIVPQLGREGEPQRYIFGTNKGSSSNDGYKDSDATRSFVRQLSTVSMSDAGFNDGHVVGEQAYILEVNPPAHTVENFGGESCLRSSI
jgi:hypothetical protein